MLNSKTIKDYFWITLGTALVAAAVKYYLGPCRIVTGSVSGLAIVLEQVVPLSNTQIILILNVVCLLAGIRSFGRRFGVRSVYVSFLLPFLMRVLPEVSLVTGTYLLNISLFLGLLTCGQCILFGLDTASGGLDTVAEVIAVKTGISTGTAIGLAGLAACLSAAPVYGIAVSLTGIAVTVANGQILNGVMRLGSYVRQAVRKRGVVYSAAE